MNFMMVSGTIGNVIDVDASTLARNLAAISNLVEFACALGRPLTPLTAVLNDEAYGNALSPPPVRSGAIRR